MPTSQKGLVPNDTATPSERPRDRVGRPQWPRARSSAGSRDSQTAFPGLTVEPYGGALMGKQRRTEGPGGLSCVCCIPSVWCSPWLTYIQEYFVSTPLLPPSVYTPAALYLCLMCLSSRLLPHLVRSSLIRWLPLFSRAESNILKTSSQCT